MGTLSRKERRSPATGSGGFFLAFRRNQTKGSAHAACGAFPSGHASCQARRSTKIWRLIVCYLMIHPSLPESAIVVSPVRFDTWIDCSATRCGCRAKHNCQLIYVSGAARPALAGNVASWLTLLTLGVELTKRAPPTAGVIRATVREQLRWRHPHLLGTPAHHSWSSMHGHNPSSKRAFCPKLFGSLSNQDRRIY